MPEGDSIVKLANTMAPALVGEPLTRAHLRREPGAARLKGRVTQAITPHGKHLVFSFSSGVGPPVGLRVHLGLDGAWYLLRRGVRWPRSPRHASVILSTSLHDAACFDAHSLELAPLESLLLRPPLATLGPDLCVGPPDPERMIARVRPHADREIADVLLDQQVAAGIGNIYKSETLFIERVNPWTLVADLDDDTIDRLYARASERLRANTGPGPRVTTRRAAPGGGPAKGLPRFWVYGRGGRGCVRCGSIIGSRVQGPQRRVTFWCSFCQA